MSEKIKKERLEEYLENPINFVKKLLCIYARALSTVKTRSPSFFLSGSKDAKNTLYFSFSYWLSPKTNLLKFILLYFKGYFYSIFYKH